MVGAHRAGTVGLAVVVRLSASEGETPLRSV